MLREDWGCQVEDLTDIEDDGQSLTKRVMDAVLEAVELGDAAAVDDLLNPLHAADIAGRGRARDGKRRRRGPCRRP